MNTIDSQYLNLVQDILDNGVKKADRTGTGTLSVFGRQFRHKVSQDAFPILTTKKMAWKQIVTELLWMLRGDTNIKWLVENNCNIWNGDAWKEYQKRKPNLASKYLVDSYEDWLGKIRYDDTFAKVFGSLGPIYGSQWRKGSCSNCKTYDDYSSNKENGPIDQIQNTIDLLRNDPDSRRILVNSWNVNELNDMVLPPCHYSFQLYTKPLENGLREVSLLWNQRSVDIALGLGFNLVSYSLLLTIFSKFAGMIPGEIIGNLGDCHLYLNHIEPIKEQLNRTSFSLPQLQISPTVDFSRGIEDFVESANISDFTLVNYQSHPPIKFDLSN